jgi:hypothetical protein
VSVVATIGESIGLLLLIVPGLVLITTWAVFVPVIVVESPGGLRGLRRSRQLVEGNGWQVFRVIMTIFILIGVLGVGLPLLADMLGTSAGSAVRVIVGVLVAPLVAIAEAIMYFDLLGIETHTGTEHPDSSGPFQPGQLSPTTS